MNDKLNNKLRLRNYRKIGEPVLFEVLELKSRTCFTMSL